MCSFFWSWRCLLQLSILAHNILWYNCQWAKNSVLWDSMFKGQILFLYLSIKLLYKRYKLGYIWRIPIDWNSIKKWTENRVSWNTRTLMFVSYYCESLYAQIYSKCLVENIANFLVQCRCLQGCFCILKVVADKLPL